ncbi:MAG: hypothetical protein R6V61_10215 [Wenzhouxiangellaceae bacterium]
MIRSIVIAVFLPLALIASSISSFASASEPSDIGFVLYTRSDSPGTLNARWIYGEQYRGPGIATGGPRDGFAGERPGSSKERPPPSASAWKSKMVWPSVGTE